MPNTIQEQLKALPDNPGIYLFFNKDKEIVYVGKATSLRSRVRSYFRGPKSPRPIEEMIHEVVRIDHRETESVLEAVILESIYIKKLQPKYNVLGKDNKSWNYIIITKDAFPRVTTMRQHEIATLKKEDPSAYRHIGAMFGPYPGLNTRAAMKLLQRLFRFSNCDPSARRPCLYYQMGQCYGVCTGEISAAEYKDKVINPLKWFLAGKKKQVIKDFERRMEAAAQSERFEEAAMIRNQLKDLYRIHDITLINKGFFEDDVVAPEELFANKNFRIEGYDISNLGITDKVGSMVVFDRNGPVKAEYRKFTIKTVAGQSDVDCLAEVLERRLNHGEWPQPDVIMLDGGRPQVNRIKKVFEARGVDIPFVGIAKGPARKRNDIVLGVKNPQFVQWVSQYKQLLIQVRDEAHRFAITFNRSKRKIQ